jgi:hypothetical protein
VFLLTDVSYRSWTVRSANARAVQRYNSCDPYCAHGRFVRRAVKVRLFKPQSYRDHWTFACMLVEGGEAGTYTLLGQPHASACRVRGHYNG